MILLIDDEPEYVINYEIALKAKGFNVKLITDVDEAIKFISEKNDEIEAIILDIMMPYGHSFNADETNLGTRTGIRLYEKIRETLPEIPIFVLTNAPDEKVKEYFGKEKKCYFREKIKPFVFAGEVSLILKGK